MLATSANQVSQYGCIYFQVITSLFVQQACQNIARMIEISSISLLD